MTKKQVAVKDLIPNSTYAPARVRQIGGHMAAKKKRPRQRKNRKKKTAANPRAAGRPQVPIDWGEFDKLCALQATLEEIAGWFDCSRDTIERAVEREHGIKFADYYINKSAAGKISIRRHQYQLAQTGNSRMLVWLGIQYLGQKHRHDVTTTRRLDYRDVKEELAKAKDAGERSRILTDFIMQNNE